MSERMNNDYETYQWKISSDQSVHAIKEVVSNTNL